MLILRGKLLRVMLKDLPLGGVAARAAAVRSGARISVIGGQLRTIIGQFFEDED